MASLSLIARGGQTNPLQRLQEWLMNAHYSQIAWTEIVAHTDREGTPTGCPYLDREDEAKATEAYVDAMEPVGPTSARWGNAGDDPSMWNPLDDRWALGAGPSLRAIPPDIDDEEFGELWEAACANHDAEMAAMEASRPGPDDAGGEPPYQPTEEDLDEYDRWSTQLQARRLGLLPIAGGAPFAPTDEDLADVQAHCDWCERCDAIRRAEDARNPANGYE